MSSEYNTPSGDTRISGGFFPKRSSPAFVADDAEISDPTPGNFGAGGGAEGAALASPIGLKPGGASRGLKPGGGAMLSSPTGLKPGGGAKSSIFVNLTVWADR